MESCAGADDCAPAFLVAGPIESDMRRPSAKVFFIFIDLPLENSESLSHLVIESFEYYGICSPSSK